MPAHYKFQDKNIGKVSFITVGGQDGLDRFYNENWEEMGSQPTEPTLAASPETDKSPRLSHIQKQAPALA